MDAVYSTGPCTVPIVFTRPPEEVRTPGGGTAVFVVVTTGGVGTLHYEWRFDNAAKAVVTVGRDSAEVIIANVKPSGAGAYWCDVTDDYTTYSSPVARLEVTAGLPVSGLPAEGRFPFSG